MALKEQEPPDSWDMELNEGPPSSKAGLPSKPSRAAAGFVLKDQKSIKKPNIEPKPVRLAPKRYRNKSELGIMDGVAI